MRAAHSLSTLVQILLYLVFILSGAAGLIYESIWSRYLGLFVGHTARGSIKIVRWSGGHPGNQGLAGEQRIHQGGETYPDGAGLVGGVVDPGLAAITSG